RDWSSDVCSSDLGFTPASFSISSTVAWLVGTYGTSNWVFWAYATEHTPTNRAISQFFIVLIVFVFNGILLIYKQYFQFCAQGKSTNITFNAQHCFINICIKLHT